MEILSNMLNPFILVCFSVIGLQKENFFLLLWMLGALSGFEGGFLPHWYSKQNIYWYGKKPSVSKSYGCGRYVCKNYPMNGDYGSVALIEPTTTS